MAGRQRPGPGASAKRIAGRRPWATPLRRSSSTQLRRSVTRQPVIALIGHPW